MTLDAIGVACKNLNESLHFYTLLNIQFKELGKGHFEGQTESGMRVMLDSFDLLKEINPAWKEPVNSGITLCFLQQSPQSVDQVYEKIVKEGYKSVKEPWNAFWGQRYASVLDPTGNQVDIFAALEDS